MKEDYKKVEKYCEVCNVKLILNNSRDIERKKLCSRKCVGIKSITKIQKDNPDFYKYLVKFNNTPEANKKKGHKGSLHPCWIEDRSKVKSKMSFKEEKDFFNEVFLERNFTCEITGEKGGKLSVHHIMGVSKNKLLMFVRSNVIVIKKEIHLLYHKIYGTRDVTKDKWDNFINKKEYLQCLNLGNS